jgi:hypothetical protein
MPSHYGKERRQARAAGRALRRKPTTSTYQPAAWDARKGLEGSGTSPPYYVWEPLVTPGTVPSMTETATSPASKVKTTPQKRKKVGTEAPELRAHGVRKSK